MVARSRGRSGAEAVEELDRVTDALLLASRALVSVAATSIAVVDPEVTLPQFRVLVVLATNGNQTMGVLAAAIGVHPSTATRMLDRLVSKRLIARSNPVGNRREVVVSLEPAGRRLVAAVTKNRRAVMSAIVARMSGSARRAAAQGLAAFAAAAGEAPEQAWTLGWGSAIAGHPDHEPTDGKGSRGQRG
jgi:DNA-binding MarR family transcriptional regulator